jgi:hypothetical protein
MNHGASSQRLSLDAWQRAMRALPRDKRWDLFCLTMVHLTRLRALGHRDVQLYDDRVTFGFWALEKRDQDRITTVSSHHAWALIESHAQTLGGVPDGGPLEPEVA